MSNIKEVAKRAGVSVSTVSAVVNKSKYVSPELTARIEKAIKDLNYRPNRLARALNQKRTLMIACVMPSVTNSNLMEILKGIMRAADEQGFTVLTLNTEGSPDRAKKYLLELVDLRVDGILFTLTWDLSNEDNLEIIEKTKWLQAVGFSGSRATSSVDCFLWNEEDAGYILARYLIRLGHRQITFIAPSKSKSAQLRAKGFERAFHEANINPLDNWWIKIDGYDAKDGYLGVIHALSSAIPFTSTITFNDSITTGVLAALTDQGFKVPENISLATFGNSHIEYARPKITSMKYDNEPMGYHVALRLISRINDDYSKPPTKEFWPLKLSVQSSTSSHVISYIQR